MPRSPNIIDELARRLAEEEDVQGPPLPEDVAQRERARLGIRESEVVRRLQERASARTNAELAGVDPRSWSDTELEQAVGGVSGHRYEEPILDPRDPNARAALTPEQVAYLEEKVRAQRAAQARQPPRERGVIERIGESIADPNAPSDEEIIAAFNRFVEGAGGPPTNRPSNVRGQAQGREGRKSFMATGDDLGGVGIAAGAPQVGAQGKRAGKTRSSLPTMTEGAEGPHSEFERQLTESMRGKTLDLGGAAQQVQAKKRDAARAALSGGGGDQGPPLPAGTRRAEAQRIGRERDAAMIMGNPALAAAFESAQGTSSRVPRRDFPREQALTESMLGVRREPILGKKGNIKGYGGYAPVMQRNPLTGEAEYVPGTIERAASAQMEIQEQEAAEAEIYAEEMRRREVELRAADDARIEGDRRRIERYADEVSAIQKQTEGLQRAADLMEKTPDLGSWWQNRTEGQKVGAVLGLILGRMAGINPMEILNTAINAEQQRAKINWQKRKDLVTARREEQAGLINAYEVLQGYASSEQELDKLVQLSMYENAQRRLERMAAEGRVRVMPGQLELARVAIQQQKAQLTYEAQGLAARSVPTRTVFSPKWPGPVRKAMMKEGAAESSFGRDVRLHGAKAQIDAAAAQGEPPPAEYQRLGATMARDTAEARTALGIIGDMSKLAIGGEAPGRFGPVTIEDVMSAKGLGTAGVFVGGPVGAGVGAALGALVGKPLGQLLSSEDKRAWNRYKDALHSATEVYVTGAAVDPNQRPRFERMLAQLDNAVTAEDEYKAVIQLRDMFINHIESIEGGYSDEVLQDFYRNPNVRPLPGRTRPVKGNDLPSDALPYDIPYK